MLDYTDQAWANQIPRLANDLQGSVQIFGSWRIPMRQRRHRDAALPKIWDAPDLRAQLEIEALN
jgi:hypothetical protein